MSEDILKDLSWLPRAPEDFRKQRRALSDKTGPIGQDLRFLATHQLSDSQLTQLAQSIADLRSAGADLSPLVPFRLGLIGNGTLDLLAPLLVASAARHGIALEVVQTEYGQLMQEAMSPDSGINSAKCDAVLLALDYRALPGLGSPNSVNDALGFIGQLRAGFRQNSGAISIVQTFAPPAEALFGHIDRVLDASPRGALDRINTELARSAAASDDVLLDVASIAELVGLANWHSPQQWNLAKLPFDAAYAPFYADHVARLVAAIKGKSRRVLILDLDNTVWGGVIGDDGLEGIRIAQGDAVGEAFLAVQANALALRARGVVLAVSSKNTDSVARGPFREHPEMLLREDHIAVFQANWSDKATNIKSIANELSLGLDAMVFLDDNPMERDLVRRMLPQVAVPELPADPALYVRTLMAAGYFETIAFSEEDRKRADFYQDNAKRVALQASAGDLDSYLASLNMEIFFAPFDAMGRKRIAQLISKSNQFNLTTRRYTEADVAELEEDPDVFTLQVRLTDAFGDNGMISVIVCRPHGDDAWEIDTWLMSCRVLKRRVEQMVLRELVEAARRHGKKRLIGVYIPTDRNALVVEHYAELGFTQVATDATDGRTVWELDTATEVPEAPMTVHRAAQLAEAEAAQ
ncbi:HAD-superfamily phosphatase, subfamily IIIC/FkbH-like domain-containing protein [Sphingomonas sp. NFR04]|uniref:HAD-IIIC family phosphatase n=1 Tax=Sphingomonas sp. NFR04 TaxID=1566283 RepID=UPI0008F09A83|nr:HAD-IIIC family phosphatase [Sphingomonas sp. NFR04]SFK19025.1 HAD-superfamily phosphatase, subfamily IIIC/FkbH-like domain-containing protein [Sphingomonas sp. NFR04]